MTPAAGVFSDADLRAIKRTFLTRKATPEEVCLVIGPRRYSPHWVVLGVPLLGSLAVAFWLAIASDVFEIDSRGPVYLLRDMLVERFWAACVIVLLLFITSYVLVPLASLPRFELWVKPGAKVVRMRGLGFEQERLAGCCLVRNRYLWCTLSVDKISYSVLRRWWQLPWPIKEGAAALDRAFLPARRAFDAAVARGEEQEERLDAARRFVLARAFGEAFLAGNEMVILLPAADWWGPLGALCSVVLGSGTIFWHTFRAPTWCDSAGGERSVCNLSSVPLWLPSAIAIVVTAFVCLWADGGFRRAVAVIPRGMRRIRIQVGNRVWGEDAFDLASIVVTDNRGSDLMDYIHVGTPFWSATTSAWRLKECSMAEQQLKVWAGILAPPEGDKRG